MTSFTPILNRLFFLLKPFQISSCSFSFFSFSLLSYPRSFLLYTSFLLAGKVWTKSSVNPGKGTLISSRCVGLFMHRFCTKNGALALSECSRYTKCTVLWKDVSSLCHKWFNDHYSKCRQKSGLALKGLTTESDRSINTGGRGLRFSRNDRTVEVIKLFIVLHKNKNKAKKPELAQ